MSTTRLGASGAAALVVLTSACGGGGDSGPTVAAAASATPQDVTALGGQATVDSMTSLYRAAQQAGEDAVVVYGPGENDKGPVYELFQQRFPGITVRGEFLVGPEFSGRVDGEFASGQHVGDLAQAGDTSVAAQLAKDRFEKFTPVNISTLSPDFQDGGGHLAGATAATFGIVYNTSKVAEPDAPKGWDDLTAPAWKGQIAAEDPTKIGGSFSALSHLVFDGRHDLGFVEKLAGQDVQLEASAPAAGTKVATGEFALNPFYPYSFYLRDKAKGAPVNFVFPMAGGNHLSPHFLGVFAGARHPNAAKLLETWLFTPEGLKAAADVGYYPLVPGTPGPADYPSIEKLDLLKPFPLQSVAQITTGNLAAVQKAFAAAG